jgi:hypothetical protein
MTSSKWKSVWENAEVLWREINSVSGMPSVTIKMVTSALACIPHLQASLKISDLPTTVSRVRSIKFSLSFNLKSNEYFYVIANEAAKKSVLFCFTC